jgi:UDP-2,3-diacylglucosamine hydrolase
VSALFISDLHLDAGRPDIGRRLSFCLAAARGRVRQLYILGDLFEAWIGDDGADAAATRVAEQLAAFAAQDAEIFFIRGNRDFLLGPDFAARCRMRLLPDPCVVELEGEPTLLMHGDSLCLGDATYQAFRTQTRDIAWQQAFLAQPLAARQAFAEQARAASRMHQQGLAQEITDVDPEAVAATLRQFGIRRLIHGHTHRPAVHEFSVNGQPCRRIVLGDWYEQGSQLWVDAGGVRLESF